MLPISNRKIIPYDGSMESKTYEINIDDLAFGGEGVGSIEAPGEEIDGLRCFVPFSSPEDRLSVRIKKRKKRFARAEIVSIITPSPYRRKPACPYFGRCGGCSWQHISYPRQLEAKASILQSQLERIGGWKPPRVQAIASPREYEYRSRARLHFSRTGKPAFIGTDGRSRVEIASCPIFTPLLQKALPDLRGDEKETLLLQEQGDKLLKSTASKNLGFQQANNWINQELQNRVQESMAAYLSPEVGSILDLCCGNGNLSLPLLEQGHQIIGYDTCAASIEEAKRKGKAVLSGKGIYRQMDAGKAVEKHLQQGDHFSALILDPPRRGLGPELIEQALDLDPQLILFAACDPAKLARDSAPTAERYEIAQAWALDMFPQSAQFEALLLLKKCSGN